MQLWEDHISIFIIDFKARHRRQCFGIGDEDLSGHILNEIEAQLQTISGKSLDHYGLPQPPQDLPPLLQPQEPAGNTTALTSIIDESVPLLNEAQRQVFREIVHAVVPSAALPETILAGSHPPTASAGRNMFFLDAPGGTGKTFVINAIQTFLELQGKTVQTVATSAVAALLLRNGRTAHSTFRIPIPVDKESTCNIPTNSSLAQQLRDLGLIIWDEAVMCNRFCIEAVDRSLRDIRNIDLPFGGICIVFSGDFRQILPVVPGGSRAQIVNACIKWSHLYTNCHTLRLHENMRLSALREDPSADEEALQFPSYLLSIGEGRSDGQGHGSMTVKLPNCVSVVRTDYQIAMRVFNGITEKYHDSEWIASRAILTVKNARLPEINAVVGNMIPGEFTPFRSADSVENAEENALRYPVELLNSLSGKGSLPDHVITLKKGFPVMLLRNIDPSNGHCNGSRYIVEKFSRTLLYLKVSVGTHKGKKLALPRMPCSPGDSNYPVPGFIRLQFPIRVCFAMTTNKSQGQSFKGNLGLDFSSPCFSHGQLYVALSRTTHPKNISVLGVDSDSHTTNVVYPEVLR